VESGRAMKSIERVKRWGIKKHGRGPASSNGPWEKKDWVRGDRGCVEKKEISLKIIPAARRGGGTKGDEGRGKRL